MNVPTFPDLVYKARSTDDALAGTECSLVMGPQICFEPAPTLAHRNDRRARDPKLARDHACIGFFSTVARTLSAPMR